nr:uncharacterized protein LOC110081331 isoform X2 [Pogona vitticeps]
METLTASSVSRRPPVLQFFRNLFGGSRRVTQEGQTPKAKVPKEKDDQLLERSGQAESEAMLLGKKLITTKISPSEVHEGMMEQHSKGPSLLKETAFENTTPAYENKLSELLNSTELEVGDADGFAGSMIHQLVQHPCEKVLVAGAEKEESSDSETLAEDGTSQLLCADDGVSMAAGTIAGVKDSSAEEEREYLLKDVRAEPAKTELYPWNRLINMYKQRRRLSSSKRSHVQRVPAQPLIEEEATLDLVVYGIAEPKAHVTLSNSAKIPSVCGFRENEAREMVDDCEIAHRDFGSNDPGSLEHHKNVY